jgi:hypothetical protein
MINGDGLESQYLLEAEEVDLPFVGVDIFGCAMVDAIYENFTTTTNN